MRIDSRGMAIILAALSLTGSAVAAPVETVLYSFQGGSDGGAPFAGVIADDSGALYGTTIEGGGERQLFFGLWHSFQADAAPQGPDHLDRDRAL
jgi:hypothetical protein